MYDDAVRRNGIRQDCPSCGRLYCEHQERLLVEGPSQPTPPGAPNVKGVAGALGPTADARRIAKGLYDLELIPDPSTVVEWSIEWMPNGARVQATTVARARGEELAALIELIRDANPKTTKPSEG